MPEYVVEEGDGALGLEGARLSMAGAWVGEEEGQKDYLDEILLYIIREMGSGSAARERRNANTLWEVSEVRQSESGKASTRHGSLLTWLINNTIRATRSKSFASFVQLHLSYCKS